MTQIDFHFNTPALVPYACRLARKIFRAGQKAVFYHPDSAVLARFDEALWTFSEREFIPHVRFDDPIAAHTPLWLSDQATDGPDSSLMVNLSSQTPEGFSRFDRLIELVSREPEIVQAGRARYRFYRDCGYPLQTHDMSALA
jgi:DNA polymerase III subunit chi